MFICTPGSLMPPMHSRLRGVNHSLSDSDVEALAATAHGFVGADIAQVWMEVWIEDEMAWAKRPSAVMDSMLPLHITSL